MDEVFCSGCNKHMGWKIYTGPSGSFFCDDCKEEEDRLEREDEEQQP